MEATETGIRRAIGRNARAARLRLNLTQEDVAHLVGLVTEVYGRLERGHMMPSVPSLCRLCVALGLTPNELLGAAVEDPPEWWHGPATRLEEDPRRRKLSRVLDELDDSGLEVVHKVARAMRQGQAPRERPARGSARVAPLAHSTLELQSA